LDQLSSVGRPAVALFRSLTSGRSNAKRIWPTSGLDDWWAPIYVAKCLRDITRKQTADAIGKTVGAGK
jgi:hypothetical protein